jgi:hypothetical protein
MSVVPEAVQGRIILLSLVLAFFLPTTYVYIRELFFRYVVLETYHDPEDEKLGKKVLLVWRINVILSLLAAGVTMLYGPFISGLGIPVSLETVVASAILFSAANITVRIASYGYLDEDPDYEDNTIRRLKKDSHNAMYSFLVSIWILLFLGICLNILNGDILTNYDIKSIDPRSGLVYSLLIIFMPLLFAGVSETVMWKGPLSVPKVLIEQLE